MAFSADAWKQLKNLTAVDLIRALERDGWEREGKRGATLAFFKNSPECNRRVVIHYHPQKTYGPKLIQGLLADIGWTETDLKRLKLIR